MKIIKLFVFVFLFLTGSFSAWAQGEELRPLGGNSILMYHQQKSTHNDARKAAATATYLPFFDDFSYNGPYADTNRWNMYKSVFVNHTYPIAPPTIGVVTFDGLARNGYPYNIYATTGSFLSDTLLSVPIRLDFTDATQTVPLSPADSIYLSFYYQAKGRGDVPEPNDVLNLFFFGPNDSLDFNSTPMWSH
ncbi:MAG TPA: hypothetical protein VNY73_11245, partial [Bacteroidia bacterium]|nr:hypothetical protein [Bacteroidia bacterium]